MKAFHSARRRFSLLPTLGLVASLALCGVFTSARAQNSLPYVEPPLPDQKYAQAIERGRTLLQALVDSSRVSGLSVAVSVDGEVVWAEGFGYADLENRTPVTPLTKFRVGSIAKSITSTGLALLYEQGKVDLDAPIQKYVPYFPQKPWPITLRELGGHLGGIRTYNYANYDPAKNEFVGSTHYASVKDAMNIFMNDPLDHQPGTKYLYTTWGFVTISAAMEGISGQDYLSYINDRIIVPLKLQNTVPEYNEEVIPYRSRYYMRNEDGKLVNTPYVDNSDKWSAGGWLSTPTDLVRLGSALIGPNLLKDSTKKIWWTSQKNADGSLTNYGIGFTVGKDFDGHRTVSHGGGSVGGTTAWVMYPDDGVVVAAIVNMSEAPTNGPTAETIAEGFINAREKLDPPATAGDVSGNYSFSAQTADGKQLTATFHLAKTKGGYAGIIVPEKQPSQPERRVQDGSYGPPQPAVISIAGVEINGNQIHVIGADSDGFDHIWFTAKGDTIDGKWTGRGVNNGTLHGEKQTMGAPAK